MNIVEIIVAILFLLLIAVAFIFCNGFAIYNLIECIRDWDFWFFIIGLLILLVVILFDFIIYGIVFLGWEVEGGTLVPMFLPMPIYY